MGHTEPMVEGRPSSVGPYLSYAARRIEETGTCPACSQNSRIYARAELAFRMITELKDPLSLMQGVTCPRCAKRWPLTTAIRIGSIHYLPLLDLDPPWTTYHGPGVGPPLTPGAPSPRAALSSVARGPDSTINAAPKEVSVRNAAVLRIDAGGRTTEILGDEVHEFDNSASSSTSVETLDIAHTSAVVIELSSARAQNVTGNAGIRILDFVNVQGTVDNALRARHSLSTTSSLTIRRTSQISIPARKHVRVTLHWKRIWEEGKVTLGNRGNPVAQIPYRLTVDLHFDKTTRDIGASKRGSGG